MKYMRFVCVLMCLSAPAFSQMSTLFNRSLAGYPITPRMVFQAYIDEQMAVRSPVPPIWINSQQVRRILYKQLQGKFSRLSYAEIEMFVNQLEDRLSKLTVEERKAQVEEWINRSDMEGIYKIDEAEKTRDSFNPRYIYD